MTNGSAVSLDFDPFHEPLIPQLEAEDPLMSDDGKVTPESLAEQLRGLSTIMTWAIGLMAAVVLSMLGTVAVLWRADGKQEAQLEAVSARTLDMAAKVDRNGERITAIESTRFTLSDGQRLIGEISAKVDTIRADISDLHSDVAVIKSKEKNR